MIFRTHIEPPSSTHSISYNAGLLSIGSCFSQHIGSRLGALGYKVSSNPAGITFNPISIYHTIKMLVEGNVLPREELIRIGESYGHYDFHSDFSSLSALESLDKINNSITRTRKQLPLVSTVIITVGTAYVYRLLETSRVVNNCHKRPGHLFSRELLDAATVISNLSQTIGLLRAYCDRELHVILTVSPVRHIKNGLAEDRRSKAILQVAAHEIAENLSGVEYFPSYEIMIDDLRDYRFYKEDMIHPSELAIDYIFDLFENCYLDKNEEEIRRKIRHLNKRRAHRPLLPQSDAHQSFLEKIKRDTENIKKDYPFVDL